MSLFGAINTAISGLTAQSAAFGNISEDVANSQTVGFKRVDTSFIDYLTTSTATNNEPGAVVAQPEYVNNVQGAITQTDNPLGMAIAGQGFFAVSQPIGEFERRADVQSAAILYAGRRLHDERLRLSGEQRRAIPEWMGGQSHDRCRRPERAGADPGQPVHLQPGRDLQRDAGGQPAGDPDGRHRDRRRAAVIADHRL